MNAIDMLGIHLQKFVDNLGIPIYEFPQGVECAFTLTRVTRACKLTDVLSAVFSEWEYVRGDSGYVSLSTALAIREVIPSSKQGVCNALRSYSYFATREIFNVGIKREELLDTLLTLPDGEPFVFAVTFNSKKHTSYKLSVCNNNQSFSIATDIAPTVAIDMNAVRAILPIMQKWYTVLPGKEQSEQAPTWFTKDEILQGCKDSKRINAYGLELYMQEDEILQPYRNTHFLEVLTRMLNKILINN